MKIIVIKKAKMTIIARLMIIIEVTIINNNSDINVNSNNKNGKKQ